MRAENVPPERTRIRYFADICYIGQSHHLEIPLNASDPDPIGLLYRDFLAAHDRIYGYSTAVAGPHRQSADRACQPDGSAASRQPNRPRPARTAVRRASPTGGF